MRENTVQSHLFWKYRSSSDVLVPSYAPSGWWENDLFRLTAAGYWYEYEFKSAVKDFRADFAKVDNAARPTDLAGETKLIRFHKHSVLAESEAGNEVLPVQRTSYAEKQYRATIEKRLGWRRPKGSAYAHPPGPNRFTFVIPDHLEEKIRPELPDYAGLIIVRLRDEGKSTERVLSVKEVVKAPQRHSQKVFDSEALRKKLFETFYWRYWKTK